MPVRFFPDKDSELLAWSLNFKNLITAAPTDYGLTAPLATAYGTLHDNFASALAAATDPSTRTKGAIEAKNQARTALKDDARLLANLVNGTASVTNQQKLDLGLTVRAMPQPIPAPSSAPVLEIISQSGWTVKIRLRSADDSKRGKPGGVFGANVFSHVGTAPPTDIGQWKFEGGTGRVNEIDIVFPNTLAAGTQVFLTAFWFNGRKESGPACAPVTCNLPGGSVGGLMKEAA